MVVLFAIVAGLALANGQPAVAGGLYLNEFATPSMGVAGAGSEAVAEDASTAFAFHNPAGMARLERSQVQLGAGVLYGRTEFEADDDTPFCGGNGGNQAGFVPLLGTYGVWSATEDLKFGMSIFSVSGAALDPEDSWSGRYQLQEIELLTVTMNPTVAYRVTDWLSVGAGAMVMYADIDYELSAPAGGAGKVEIDGNDWAYGYNAGALIELGPRTRIGAIYVSEVEPDFSGDLNVRTNNGPNFSTDSSLEFTFPQAVRVGAYHEIDDQWAILGTAGWEDWSSFDELLVGTQAGSASVDTEWQDTYHFSVGLHYRPTEDWLLQTGFTYDTSPVSDGNRLAAIPADRQYRFAVGAQHLVTEGIKVGGSFEYIDLGEAEIDDSNTLKGKYDNNYAVVFALNVNFEF